MRVNHHRAGLGLGSSHIVSVTFTPVGSTGLCPRGMGGPGLGAWPRGPLAGAQLSQACPVHSTAGRGRRAPFPGAVSTPLDQWAQPGLSASGAQSRALHFLDGETESRGSRHGSRCCGAPGLPAPPVRPRLLAAWPPAGGGGGPGLSKGRVPGPRLQPRPRARPPSRRLPSRQPGRAGLLKPFLKRNRAAAARLFLDNCVEKFPEYMQHHALSSSGRE